MKFLAIYLSIFILAFYFCGVFASQSGNALFMGGMLTRLSGESAFALMSLLGAHIMPHNFYLHSSVVQVLLFYPLHLLKKLTEKGKKRKRKSHECLSIWLELYLCGL